MKKVLLLLLIITTHSLALAQDFFEPKNAGVGFLVGTATTALCGGAYYFAQKNTVDRNNLTSICAFTHIISPLIATIAAVSLAKDKKSKEETRNVAIMIDTLGGLFLPTSNLRWYYVLICKCVGNSIAVCATPAQNKDKITETGAD
jgi:hypothetical protein